MKAKVKVKASSRKGSKECKEKEVERYDYDSEFIRISAETLSFKSPRWKHAYSMNVPELYQSPKSSMEKTRGN